MSKYHITRCDKPEISFDVLLVWVDVMGNDTAMIGYYVPKQDRWYAYSNHKSESGDRVPEPLYWLEYDKELPDGTVLA